MTVIRVTVTFERTIVDNKEERQILEGFSSDDVLQMFHCIGSNTLVFPSIFQVRKKYAEIEPSKAVREYVNTSSPRLRRFS